MPWIQNVAATDMSHGWHIDVGENSMLIQIMDDDQWWPTPKHSFKEIHKFIFLDIEGDCKTNLGDGELTDMKHFAISDKQAQELVDLLKHAMDNNMNVVVHCLAGVCRSGAVVEVGVKMGFQDPETFRSPNILVKNKMLKAAGLPFDPGEKPDMEAWRKFRHVD
jgi:predicted protein tyrosine phosphatase